MLAIYISLFLINTPHLFSAPLLNFILKVKSVSCSTVSDSMTSWTIACQAPLSMWFSRQEFWSGLPFPSAGDIPDPWIRPGSPTLQTHSLPSEPLLFWSLFSVQLLSHAHQASLSITNSQSLLKLISIELVMPSNHLILCCPLLLPSSIFPSIRVFSNESVLPIRWPNYWSFSISPSNEYSGLICFGIEWLDLLAVQETLKSFLQHHSSKPSVLCRSAFFMVQLSNPYMTTEKNTVPLSQWCHPTISSSVVPFSSCLWSFPASGSFPMSQFFTSGGQNIEASASASVPPMNIHD